MEEEKTDNLRIKDVVVLSTVTVAVIIGIGGLVQLGADLTAEGLKKLKTKKNQSK
jgi:hypothetical protein